MIEQAVNQVSAVAAAPAFHAAGGAVGPGVTALFLTAGSFYPVNVLAGSAVVASVTLFALALGLRAQVDGGRVVQDAEPG
jgi:hypothetical protein